MRTPKGKIGWARFFANLIESEHPAAAAVLRAIANREPTPAPAAGPPRKLPRGVFEKHPGSGVYWIRYDDGAGKIRREKIGPSLSAAREIVEQRRCEVRLGKFKPETVGRARPKRMTVAEMFRTYLPTRLVRNKFEDLRYSEFWTKLFGKRALDDLTPADLERWRAERLKHVKPATVNRALEYLRAFIFLAMRDGHCQQNPVAKLGLLPENNERHRYLELHEEAALKAAMTAEHFDVVLLAIHTGMRRGEQFGLRWDDIDFPRKQARLAITKSGKHRFVHLSEQALAVLERQRGRSKGPWVFPHPTDPTKALVGDWFVKRVYKPALAKAGVKDITFHDLRHTFGSRLAEKGHSLHTIGTLLGHTTPSMTKRYANLSAQHLVDAVNSIATPAVN